MGETVAGIRTKYREQISLKKKSRKNDERRRPELIDHAGIMILNYQ